MFQRIDVCGGFTWVDVEGFQKPLIGSDTPLVESIDVPLLDGVTITGVVGRSGYLIDRLEFILSTGDKIRCGGDGGREKNVTAPGRNCKMTNIAGTTNPEDGLATLEFTWQCEE